MATHIAFKADNTLGTMKQDTHQATTHIGVARIMAIALESYGCNPSALFEQAGIHLQTQSTDERVNAIAMQKLWRLAVETTKDEAFGLTFAQHMQPAALHGLGFAWMASSTLYDAFKRLVRYYRIISTAGEILLDEEADHVTLWFKVPFQGRAAPASIDAALALFVQLCRLTKGMDFSPVKVELFRDKPESPEKFDQFFGCPTEFNAEENRLYFDINTLNSPLPMANPELARINDQIIVDYLKRHDTNNIVSQVRALIIDSLPDGAPSQETIAKALHVSARSLQRKLSLESVTYKNLLEEVRLDLAKQYLKESGRSIAEVTYLLGFSEPSNFSRSFKRWTGQTPQAFQAL